MISRFAGVLALTVLLQGCGSPPPAPVDRRQEPPSEKINYHVVSRGETLFSIAWRYEKDLHKLAAVNNLPSSYTIYPGQRLFLDTSRIVVKPKSEPIATKNRIKSQTPAARPKASIADSVKQGDRPSTVKTRQPTSSKLPSSWRWSWPTKGKVARHYNARELFKGIDIYGLPGSAIMPAGPGVVVYAGDGLRGYGKLIIVRHSNVFLSAYGHNRRIFVKEGAVVRSGQKIAEVGGDPANVRRFYFEIRKDGKPVNPLNLLPKQ